MNLVAAEPQIECPISLNGDAQWCLWIAEKPEYPTGLRIAANKEDGKKQNRPVRDRISILEDSDGDGVMDKKFVFVEELELVTSLVFYIDGAAHDLPVYRTILQNSVQWLAGKQNLTSNICRLVTP